MCVCVCRTHPNFIEESVENARKQQDSVFRKLPRGRQVCTHGAEWQNEIMKEIQNRDACQPAVLRTQIERRKGLRDETLFIWTRRNSVHIFGVGMGGVGGGRVPLTKRQTVRTVSS